MIKQGFKHPFLLLLHDIAPSPGTGEGVQLWASKRQKEKKPPLPPESREQDDRERQSQGKGRGEEEGKWIAHSALAEVSWQSSQQEVKASLENERLMGPAEEGGEETWLGVTKQEQKFNQCGSSPSMCQALC